MKENKEAPASPLDSLNQTGQAELGEMFKAVCHSSKWVDEMLSAAPFQSATDLKSKGASAWSKCQEADWIEALQGHPRIGERQAGNDLAAQWSRGEQAAAASPDEQRKSDLRAKQLAYEDKFGFLFLICATGRSTEEILAALDHRLEQSPQEELQTVAEELAKIIDLRLEKLLS